MWEWESDLVSEGVSQSDLVIEWVRMWVNAWVWVELVWVSVCELVSEFELVV